MTSIELHPGDNRETLRRLIDEGVRVHSCVTDPPYGLVSIQKRFGKQNAKPARTEKNDGSFARLSGGFMNAQWDATGIERDPEFWKLIYDILLPGGFVFAFSSARTGHWQACAMETAGFIMHPMHGWCFGSGFPKGHAADKAIDKSLGIEGGFIPEGDPVKRMIPGADQHKNGWEKNNGREYQPGRYVPGSPEAAAWEGWVYGTQSQKPALEPIYLGQKPFSERTGAANLLKHGVGAVNIADCRVGGDPDGRYPANLILDGSPDVVAMFPASAGAAAPVKGTEPSGVTKDIYGKFAGRVPGTFFNDSGSAARFFHQFPQDQYEELDVTWTSETGLCLARLLVDTEQSPPRVIAASGSMESSDWNTFLSGNGITDLSLTDIKSITRTRTNSTTESRTLNWLIHSLTNASTVDACSETASGSNRAEHAESSVTSQITMSAKTAFHLGANLVQSGALLSISVVGARHADPLIYNGKAAKADRAGSVHPTVKPIALMRYLIRHITPPGGTVLDPFAGSGTTGAAAELEQMNCILMEESQNTSPFLGTDSSLTAMTPKKIREKCSLSVHIRTI